MYLLFLKQSKEGISGNRVQRLKNDITIHWYSRSAAVPLYLSRIDIINAIVQDLSISSEDVPSPSSEQRHALAEFVTVLAEVRCEAQLEVYQKATMS